MIDKKKAALPGTASNRQSKGNNNQRIIKKNVSCTLIFNYRLGFFTICRTIDRMRGKRPEGIAIMWGSRDECLEVMA